MARIDIKRFVQVLDGLLTRGDCRHWRTGHLTPHTTHAMAAELGVPPDVVGRFLDGVILEIYRLSNELRTQRQRYTGEFIWFAATKILETFEVRDIVKSYLFRIAKARLEGNDDREPVRTSYTFEARLTPKHAWNALRSQLDGRGYDVLSPHSVSPSALDSIIRDMADGIGIPESALRAYIPEIVKTIVNHALRGPVAPHWDMVGRASRFFDGEDSAFQCMRVLADHITHDRERRPKLHESRLTAQGASAAIADSVRDFGMLMAQFPHEFDAAKVTAVIDGAARKLGVPPEVLVKYCAQADSDLMKSDRNATGLERWQFWALNKVADFHFNRRTYRVPVTEVMLEPGSQNVTHDAKTEVERLRTFHLTVIASALVKALACTGVARDETRLFPGVSTETVSDAIRASSLDPEVFMRSLKDLGRQLTEHIRKAVMDKYDVMVRETVRPILEITAKQVGISAFELGAFIAAYEATAD